MRKLILFSIAVILININLEAQINALFSVDATQGCEPLVVQFADASTSNGTIVSWDWDFDDGSTDDVPTPIHTFEASGSDYNVCLVVADDLAQMDTFCLTITVFETPVLDAMVANPLCSGENNGSIDLIVSGGTPPYIYLWSTGETTQDLMNLSAGLYAVTVVDANGCSDAGIFEMIEPSPLIISISITNDLLCADECTGVILAIASGGCGNYTYLWNNNVQGQENAGLCDGGLYSVTVTDCNGCTETLDITMAEPPLPLELEYEVTCATSANDGTIDLSVSGGSSPYVYSWSTGAITQDLSNLPPGDYTIQVTDANGCTITETIPLSTMIVSMSNDTIVCAGDELQLFVDAPDAVSIEWVPADNLSCTDCPDPVFTAGIFGAMTYLVTTVDAAGCIDQDFVVISIQSYLDFGLLQFSNSPVFEGDTLELYCHVFNSAVVEWTGPDNFSSNECNPIIPATTGSNEGQYSVMITDEYGCEASASVNVDILTIIDSIGEGGAVCLGGTYQLFVNAPNAVSIEWFPATTLDDPFSATPIATPDQSGHYTVIVEDAGGNIDMTSIYVAIDNVPVLNIAGPTEVCNGEDIIICTDSGYPGTYFWTGPNGFSVTTPCFTLQNFEGSMSGCYQVIYTSPLGCQTTAEICISVIDFQIESITDNALICYGESATLEVVAPGAVTYQWVPETGLDCPTCPSVVATVEQITAFQVIVTDANGCQDEAIAIVDVDFDCVWPGDTDTSKLVDNFDLLNIGLAYDSVGPTRDNATIFWDGQSAFDWFLTQPGIDVDFKHIDCNGDGLIDANDTLAITQNWGEMHNFTGDIDNEVNFTLDPPFYIEPDTLIEGESISLPVILGDMDNPANSVYGLAFSLEYDSTVVVPGSAKMTFNDGWIGLKGLDMITIQKTFVSPGVIDVGMTRIDGEEMDGFGEIGHVFITIEDDILFRNGEDDSRNGDALEVNFNISNVRIINRLGEEIPVSAMETTTVVDGTVGVKTIPWKDYIQVQPNPAQDAFYTTVKNINIETIGLFTITGERVLSQKPDAQEIQINTQNLLPGVYLLKIQTGLGILVERVVIAR